MTIRCGDCAYFVRDGKCGWYQSAESKQKHPFEHAPFWVWSDCYSDKEQVRRDVTSMCATFAPADLSTTLGNALKEAEGRNG